MDFYCPKCRERRDITQGRNCSVCGTEMLLCDMDHAYCPKCHEPRDGTPGTPCGVCGTKMWMHHGSPEHYVFTKHKGISYLPYKEIISEVELTGDCVRITQTNAWLALFKRPSTSITIPYAEIQEVTRYHCWDFWNMAFAVFMILVSKMCHWAWLLFVLFLLWSAAGQAVAIYYKDGSVWRIPIGGWGKDPWAEQFMEELKKRMPKGVL